MKEKILLSYAKGITNSPSDLLCSDGELAECVNLEVKDGELVPAEMPVKMCVSMDEDEVLVLVHNIKSYGKNYFTITNGVLKCFRIENGEKEYYAVSVEVGDIKSIRSLGNTVVAYSASTPHYLVFSDGLYKYLGTTLPNINLSFDLEGKMVVSDTFEVDVSSLDDDKTPDMTLDENVEKATNQIIPMVNKFIAEESEEKGLFIYPFFVRYAYRLYDGTYVMQSSPVLMMPSTTMAPICGYLARQESRPPFHTFIAAVPSKLKIMKNSPGVKFSDWSDVISSVVIFVSAPIRTYDQEGEIKSVTFTTGESPSLSSCFYGRMTNDKTDQNQVERKHKIEEKLDVVDNKPSSRVLWELPQKDIGDILSEISGCSLFYRYAAYSPSFWEKTTSVTVTPEDTGVNPVMDIVSQERLEDDYMTHDILVPESSFVYNSRLNISNIKRRLFKGYSAIALAQGGEYYVTTQGYYYVYTYIKTLSGTVIVKSEASYRTFEMYGVYLYYPDTDAYKMVIHDVDRNRYAEVPLTEHSGLNGAFYFDGFNDLVFKDGDPGIEETDLQEEYLPNKLFTSEVNNPFRFPLSGVNTIGNGEILGISAVTRPISQGQFGEYPLIVFCTDGNFALKVDSYGFYSGISPIQEDVVLDGGKITPMENSVVLITKKGIMLTSGNEMTQIAVNLNGGNFNTRLLEGLGTSNTKIGSLVEKAYEDEGFMSYLYGSKMAYDYASDRLIIYNPDKNFSYIYHFSNATVTKMILGEPGGILTSVIDYPDTILQDKSGNLYSVYEKEDINSKADKQLGFVITRPLKFGNAASLKSIKQILNLWSKINADSSVRYLIYGSNDNQKYYKIQSRFGKPYKYYRIAIYTDMLPKEALSGTVLTVDERRTNKLR